MTSARSASIALSLLMLLTTFATSPASPLFASAFLSFDTGGQPVFVAVGDLNGDRTPDLVVANSFAAVSVLLGNGDGTFGANTDLPIGGATSVAIADLNADGKLDLAVTGSNTVSVLLGNGDGTFGAKTDFTTGPGPASVAIGDLNADGKLDLAVANLNSSTVSVLLGNGDGTFGAKTDFTTGLIPRSVAIGDLDADGRPDLAVAANEAGAVSVLRGNGDGTFGPKTDIATGTLPYAVVVVDLNADGKLDLAVANFGSYTVSVLLGNGEGTFGPKADFATGPGPRSLAIGDLNNDGNPDLAVTGYDDGADFHSNTVSVLIGNGNGTFGPNNHIPTGSVPMSVAIGDLNADGKLDLAVANLYSNTVSVLLGNGDGTFGAKTDFTTGQNRGSTAIPGSIAIRDLNADGKPDLAVVSDSVSVLLGNGDGTFGGRSNFGTGLRSIAIGDLNADGRPDLAVVSGYSSVAVLLGNGDGTFGAETGFVTGDNARSVAIGDLNADGKPDLAVADSDPPWTVSVLLGNGDGTFGPKTDFATGPGSGSVAIGDLNQDGIPDLAVTNGSSTVSVLLGKGDGTFKPKEDFGTGRGRLFVAIGDLNADGKPDLIVVDIIAGSAGVSALLNLGPSAPPLSARAFVVGGRTISVGSGPSNVCAQIEPVNQSFALPDVDLSSLSMVSEGTGSVSRINATVSKGSPRSDLDRNGVAEISACFSRGDLAKLFSSIQDRRDVEVAIQGKLGTGRQFAATLRLTIKAKPVSGRRLAASFAPNPMNPRGVLKLTTSARGYVSVRFFDLSGRLVRTVARAQIFDAGDHAFALDGRDDRGAALARGVYFYRIESPDGVTTGRFAIAK